MFATKGYVATEISVATEQLGRDKSNSSKRLVRSRHPNNELKHLRSQPEDNLSSDKHHMSRHEGKDCQLDSPNFALN